MTTWISNLAQFCPYKGHALIGPDSPAKLLFNRLQLLIPSFCQCSGSMPLNAITCLLLTLSSQRNWDCTFSKPCINFLFCHLALSNRAYSPDPTILIWFRWLIFGPFRLTACT